MAKPKVITPEQMEEIRTKDYFDCIAPATIKFYTDYYIIGDSYYHGDNRYVFKLIAVHLIPLSY